MTKVYLTTNDNLYDKLKELCKPYVNDNTPILKGTFGKPYYEGNGIYFNITHSFDVAAIAISDGPVGVDIEQLKARKYESILASLSQTERANIKSFNDFLVNWTAKEAFIKMKGLSIASQLKNCTYTGGNMFYNGEQQHCNFCTELLKDAVLTVCCSDENIQIYQL
jgi:phosphopantetheinyl transferase